MLHTSSYVPSCSEEAESSLNDDAGKKPTEKPACDKGGKTNYLGSMDQHEKSVDDFENINSTNSINTASPTVNTASHSDALDDHSKMTNLENIGIFENAYDDSYVGVEVDYNNLETVISVNPIPSTRVHKDHPKDQIIRDVHSVVHTGRITKQSEAGLITFINKQRRTNYKDFQN
ncbi:hypothetical protein Tco_0301591, partial [Tanacetum coccineum]